jgi:hypothetical protein
VLLDWNVEVLHTLIIELQCNFISASGTKYSIWTHGNIRLGKRDVPVSGIIWTGPNTLWMAFIGVFEISEILINSSIFFIYCFEVWQYTPLAIQPQFRDWDIGLEPLMLLQVTKSYFPEAKGLFPVSHRLFGISTPLREDHAGRRAYPRDICTLPENTFWRLYSLVFVYVTMKTRKRLFRWPQSDKTIGDKT